MNTRTDISEYIIHSVRTPDHNDFPKGEYEFIENDYFPLIDGDSLYSEFDVLTNIINEGGLRAHLSFRKGKPTIYGNTPVICFTEMPLLNYIQYTNLRNDRTRFTEYGVAILKKEAYKNGARPVISGLSADNEFKFIDYEKRILHMNVLPYCEQYRYIKLDLSQGNDWTHEREWRIACRNKNYSVRDDYNANTFLTYGLNIFSDFLFSEVIIIVNTDAEASDIFQLVQDQLDSGYSLGGQEFTTNIKYLIVEKALLYIKENNLSRIEELPPEAYYKHSYETLSDDEIKIVHRALKECADKSKIFAEEFFQKHNLVTDEEKLNFDLCGFATVSSSCSNNKYYRYLLSENLATAVRGSLWLNTLSDYDLKLQSITYRVHMCEKQCEILNRQLDDIFNVISNLD